MGGGSGGLITCTIYHHRRLIRLHLRVSIFVVGIDGRMEVCARGGGGALVS